MITQRRHSHLTREQILYWLAEHGYQILRFEGVRREEARLRQRCLVCGEREGRDKNPCYVNLETGLYFCHRCGSGGSVGALMKEQGGLYSIPGGKKTFVKKDPPREIDPKEVEGWHRALLDNKKALERLAEFRCLPVEALVKAKVGLKSVKDRAYEFTVPYFKGGRPRYVKVFSWSGKEKKVYRLPAGSESFPWGLDDVKKGEPVIVCEGEFDAMVLRAAGLPNVISTPDGSSSRKREWIDFLEPFPEVVLAYDADDAGQEGMLGKVNDRGEHTPGVADTIGLDRCRIVEWPTVDGKVVKDPTDFARLGQIQMALHAIEAAEKPQGSSLLHGEELEFAFSEAGRMRGKIPAFKTGFPELDRRMGGGWRTGEVTMVTGFAGDGKSAFCDNIILTAALSGIPSLLCSFELSVEETSERLIQIMLGKWFAQIYDESGRGVYLEREVATQGEIDWAAAILGKKPMTVLNHFGQMDLDDWIKLVERSARRDGTKFVLLDHLQYMLDDDSDKAEIGNAMKELTKLAKRADVGIWCVSHQVKPGGDAPKASGYGMYGSMRLKADAHFVLVVSQDGKPETEMSIDVNESDPPVGKAEILVDKARRLSGRRGVVKMDFDHKGHRFVERTRDSPIVKLLHGYASNQGDNGLKDAEENDTWA